MKTAFLAVATVCLLAVSIGVLWVLGEAHQDLVDIHEVLIHADEQVAGIGVVVADAQNAVNMVTEAEARQTVYWDQTARQTAGTVKALRLLIDRTDKSLNDQTIPALNLLLKESDAWLLLTNNDADKLTEAANATLDSATHDFDLMGMRLGDPHIDSILGNFDETSLHLSLMAAHGDGVLDM